MATSDPGAAATGGGASLPGPDYSGWSWQQVQAALLGGAGGTGSSGGGGDPQTLWVAAGHIREMTALIEEISARIKFNAEGVRQQWEGDGAEAFTKTANRVVQVLDDHQNVLTGGSGQGAPLADTLHDVGYALNNAKNKVREIESHYAAEAQRLGAGTSTGAGGQPVANVAAVPAIGPMMDKDSSTVLTELAQVYQLKRGGLKPPSSSTMPVPGQSAKGQGAGVDQLDPMTGQPIGGQPGADPSAGSGGPAGGPSQVPAFAGGAPGAGGSGQNGLSQLRTAPPGTGSASPVGTGSASSGGAGAPNVSGLLGQGSSGQGSSTPGGQNGAGRPGTGRLGAVPVGATGLGIGGTEVPGSSTSGQPGGGLGIAGVLPASKGSGLGGTGGGVPRGLGVRPALGGGSGIPGVSGVPRNGTLGGLPRGSVAVPKVTPAELAGLGLGSGGKGVPTAAELAGLGSGAAGGAGAGAGAGKNVGSLIGRGRPGGGALGEAGLAGLGLGAGGPKFPGGGGMGGSGMPMMPMGGMGGGMGGGGGGAGGKTAESGSRNVPAAFPGEPRTSRAGRSLRQRLVRRDSRAHGRFGSDVPDDLEPPELPYPLPALGHAPGGSPGLALAPGGSPGLGPAPAGTSSRGRRRGVRVLGSSPVVDPGPPAARGAGRPASSLSSGLLGGRPKAENDGRVKGFFDSGRRPASGSARLLRASTDGGVGAGGAAIDGAGEGGADDGIGGAGAADRGESPAQTFPPVGSDPSAPVLGGGAFSGSSRVTSPVLGRSKHDSPSKEMRQ